MSETLSLQGLKLAYGDTVVVPDLSLTVPPGSFTALLGPSGCGKSTTMRAIAGLLPINAGSVRLGERDITLLPPNRRGIGLVFQSYALFPHLSVLANVAFGLKLARVRKDQLHERVADALTRVGMTKFATRMPAELSGGQQQRVALARALVLRPTVLLLDEPLSNLDARLRIEMRTELQRLQREFDVTMIYVTHDQAEAMALADQVIVMQSGKIEQVGMPETIWHAPETDFVARFVGFENIFPVRGTKMHTAKKTVVISELKPGAQGLAWRPNDVLLGQGPNTATIVGTSFLGQSRAYTLDTSLGTILAEEKNTNLRRKRGEQLLFDLPLEAAAVLSQCTSSVASNDD